MLINKDLIVLNADFRSREEAVEKIARLFDSQGRLNDVDGYIQAVYDREAQFSTNLGDGIGMPHAKSKNVKEASLAFARLKTPIPWGEEEDVRLILQIAVPAGECDLYLKLLANFSRYLVHDDFREKLFTEQDPEVILQLINNAAGGNEK